MRNSYYHDLIFSCKDKWPLHCLHTFVDLVENYFILVLEWTTNASVLFIPGKNVSESFYELQRNHKCLPCISHHTGGLWTREGSLNWCAIGWLAKNICDQDLFNTDVYFRRSVIWGLLECWRVLVTWQPLSLAPRTTWALNFFPTNRTIISLMYGLLGAVYMKWQL